MLRFWGLSKSPFFEHMENQTETKMKSKKELFMRMYRDMKSWYKEEMPSPHTLNSQSLPKKPRPRVRDLQLSLPSAPGTPGTRKQLGNHWSLGLIGCGI